ncbi:hypothetical protein [Rhizobium sp. HT1-10]|uniref:hypothetical protein n=1 Tax=Rhizobium sp. HT1-10 TaxID=3111638 RepID=UPI003C16E10E
MDKSNETSASASVIELQDSVMPIIADLLDSASSRGWTKEQVLDAITFTVAQLRQADEKDPDPADDPSESEPIQAARLEEPANDWPAG